MKLRSILKTTSKRKFDKTRSVIIDETYNNKPKSSTSFDKGKGVTTSSEPENPLLVLMKEIQALNMKVDSITALLKSQKKAQTTLSKNFKPKTEFLKPYELCRYNNHQSDDCYKILLCKICKGIDHMTSENSMYIVVIRNVSKHKVQFSHGETSIILP